MTLNLFCSAPGRRPRRRPAQGVFNASFQRARRRQAAPQGEVVDVEVREVHDAHPGPKPGA